MRDAIIVSGWNWQSCNVPERMALALAHAGRRILYCENPVSLFWNEACPLTQVEPGIFVFGLKFYGHRFGMIPGVVHFQTKALVKQIMRSASILKLRDPLFIYPHGEYCVALSRELKKRGFRLVHICMDYEWPGYIEHAEQSDITLVIPPVAFHELSRRFGNKVRLLPQLGWRSTLDATHVHEAAELSTIARPRLGYLGDLTGRVSLELLSAVLIKHPEWQFISFGYNKWLPLANEHVIPWRAQGELRSVVAALDVGFMPYNCADRKNLHCVPLKLFDYFARGMPVVSTPIVHLRSYGDLIYLGATADELTSAVSAALAEPADSPKRAKRVAIAQQHSLENLSEFVTTILTEPSR